MMQTRQHKRYLVRSPLRYPGGKAFLIDTVRSVVTSSVFIEAYTGSAVLSLNMVHSVKTVILNDMDPGIYAIWQSIADPTLAEKFAQAVESASIDISTYNQCADIFRIEHEPTIELAFATLFLNRTNFGGMLGATVIGGLKQDGKYKMSVRFNKRLMATRIRKASRLFRNVKVLNMDAIDLTDMDGFLYLDPPYLDIDGRIYRYNYSHDDMRKLLNGIIDRKEPWMLSHSPNEMIENTLSDFYSQEIDHRYGINTPSEKGSVEKIWSNVPLPIQLKLID